MDELSGLNFTLFKPDVLKIIDAVVYRLSGGFLFNKREVEKTEVYEAFEWYYISKVRELNEMRYRIAELKKIKSEL